MRRMFEAWSWLLFSLRIWDNVDASLERFLRLSERRFHKFWNWGIILTLRFLGAFWRYNVVLLNALSSCMASNVRLFAVEVCWVSVEFSSEM